MAENYNEEVVSEGAEYSPKSEFSKPRICEKAIMLCLESRGSEMKAGYFNTKIDKNGDPHKSWVEDSRKVFIGKVNAIKCLMSPEIGESKTTKEKIKELDEKVKKIFESYSYKEVEMKKNKSNRLVWIKTGNKIIPEIDDPVVIVINPQFPNKASFQKGGWNLKVNAYWNELVEIYDKMFSQLNNLAHELNYFKTGVSF